MSDPATRLNDQELQRIGDYVRGNLTGWLTEVAPQFLVGPQIVERLTRLEEQVKAQGDLSTTRFDAVDRRFEGVDQRFDAIDKRFEGVDRKFEAVDRQFGTVNKRIDAVEARLDAIDKRVDDMDAHMDKRFSLMQWTIGAGFTAIVVLMSVYEFIS